MFQRAIELKDEVNWEKIKRSLLEAATSAA
jgi:hypothetical protein